MSVSKSTLYRARKLAGDLGPVGAPRKAVRMKSVPVMLDAESLAIADQNGPGTRSFTIRAALLAYQK